MKGDQLSGLLGQDLMKGDQLSGLLGQDLMKGDQLSGLLGQDLMWNKGREKQSSLYTRFWGVANLWLEDKWNKMEQRMNKEENCNYEQCGLI
jgi:hypothetical protein